MKQHSRQIIAAVGVTQKRKQSGPQKPLCNSFGFSALCRDVPLPISEGVSKELLPKALFYHEQLLCTRGQADVSPLIETSVWRPPQIKENADSTVCWPAFHRVAPPLRSLLFLAIPLLTFCSLVARVEHREKSILNAVAGELGLVSMQKTRDHRCFSKLLCASFYTGQSIYSSSRVIFCSIQRRGFPFMFLNHFVCLNLFFRLSLFFLGQSTEQLTTKPALLTKIEHRRGKTTK